MYLYIYKCIYGGQKKIHARHTNVFLFPWLCIKVYLHYRASSNNIEKMGDYQGRSTIVFPSWLASFSSSSSSSASAGPAGVIEDRSQTAWPSTTRAGWASRRTWTSMRPRVWWKRRFVFPFTISSSFLIFILLAGWLAGCICVRGCLCLPSLFLLLLLLLLFEWFTVAAALDAQRTRRRRLSSLVFLIEKSCRLGPCWPLGTSVGAPRKLSGTLGLPRLIFSIPTTKLAFSPSLATVSRQIYDGQQIYFIPPALAFSPPFGPCRSPAKRSSHQQWLFNMYKCVALSLSLVFSVRYSLSLFLFLPLSYLAYYTDSLHHPLGITTTLSNVCFSLLFSIQCPAAHSLVYWLFGNPFQSRLIRLTQFG